MNVWIHFHLDVVRPFQSDFGVCPERLSSRNTHHLLQKVVFPERLLISTFLPQHFNGINQRICTIITDALNSL